MSTHAEIFWGHVDMSDGPDACWPWPVYCYPNGYGQAWCGKMVYAHRMAWALVNGVDPLTLGRSDIVRHHCDNPPCCNPRHLACGTQAANLEDMTRKGRRARTCPKLTAEQIVLLRRDVRSSPAVAAEYGISPSMVRKIRRREQWAEVA